MKKIFKYYYFKYYDLKVTINKRVLMGDGKLKLALTFFIKNLCIIHARVKRRAYYVGRWCTPPGKSAACISSQEYRYTECNIQRDLRDTFMLDV